MRRRKAILGPLLRGLLLPALCVAVLLFFSTALNSLDQGQGEEAQRQLEEALRRGCLLCRRGDLSPQFGLLKGALWGAGG